jgi:hypothetical protein
MQPVRTPPTMFDSHLGEDLLRTFREMPERDGSVALVLGNSQQYTSSLPRGATIQPDYLVESAMGLVSTALEKAYPGRWRVYVAAAPNQNFAESLWQCIYHFKVAKTAPGAVIVQSSFDTFRKVKIRPGFQTLLRDEAFAIALERLVATKGSRAWADEFRAAIAEDAARQTVASTTKPKTVEQRLKDGLELLPLYAKRQSHRTSFLNTLYLARVHALGISPTTKRNITGHPLAQNFEALEDLLDLAKNSGALIVVYNAPVNPGVDMFFKDEYEAYLARLTGLVESVGGHFADLGAAVEQEHWGYWIDGPDPIHFDERGHQELAVQFTAAFGAAFNGGHR